MLNSFMTLSMSGCHWEQVWPFILVWQFLQRRPNVSHPKPRPLDFRKSIHSQFISSLIVLQTERAWFLGQNKHGPWKAITTSYLGGCVLYICSKYTFPLLSFPDGSLFVGISFPLSLHDSLPHLQKENPELPLPACRSNQLCKKTLLVLFLS